MKHVDLLYYIVLNCIVLSQDRKVVKMMLSVSIENS